MYSDEYINFLIEFHAKRDYFECHEIGEDFWKKEANDEEKSVWLGLIMVSVSIYHYRRGNTIGAKKLLKKAILILENEKKALEKLSIDYKRFINLLIMKYQEIEQGLKYESFNIPLTSKLLSGICRKKSEQSGLIWCSNSDMNNNYIINKHAKRDRKEVIEQRKNALENKKRP